MQPMIHSQIDTQRAIGIARHLTSTSHRNSIGFDVTKAEFKMIAILLTVHLRTPIYKDSISRTCKSILDCKHCIQTCWFFNTLTNNSSNLYPFLTRVIP